MYRFAVARVIHATARIRHFSFINYIDICRYPINLQKKRVHIDCSTPSKESFKESNDIITNEKKTYVS